MIEIARNFELYQKERLEMLKDKRLKKSTSHPIQHGGVTPEEAIEIMARNGVKITKNEAEEILEIMYFFANLLVKQHFNL